MTTAAVWAVTIPTRKISRRRRPAANFLTRDEGLPSIAQRV